MVMPVSISKALQFSRIPGACEKHDRVRCPELRDWLQLLVLFLLLYPQWNAVTLAPY